MFAQRPSQSSPTRSSSITYFFPFFLFLQKFPNILYTKKRFLSSLAKMDDFCPRLDWIDWSRDRLCLIKALSPLPATMSTAFQWLTCILRLNAKVKPHCRVIMFNNAVNILNVLQRLTVEICKMLSAVNNSSVFSMTRKPVQCITKEPRNDPV